MVPSEDLWGGVHFKWPATIYARCLLLKKGVTCSDSGVGVGAYPLSGFVEEGKT